MTPGGRGTRTGGVLERMVLPALELGNYDFDPHFGYLEEYILDGVKRYKPDVVAWDADGRKIIISLKWQQTSGSAEAKIPFEVIQLIDIIRCGQASKAYIVIGGNGWSGKVKEWYLNHGLRSFIPDSESVEIIELGDFIAKANSGAL